MLDDLFRNLTLSMVGAPILLIWLGTFFVRDLKKILRRDPLIIGLHRDQIPASDSRYRAAAIRNLAPYIVFAGLLALIVGMHLLASMDLTAF